MRFSGILALLVVVPLVTGCFAQRRVLPAARILKIAPPPPDSAGEAVLGVHLANGRLIVLDTWEPDDGVGPIRGRGTLFDVHREPILAAGFSTPRDSVVLLETTVPDSLEFMYGEAAGTTLLAWFGASAVAGILFAVLLNSSDAFGL